MAWLETKGDVFRIRFRFGGAKHLCALSTSDETEAKDALSRFEANLRLIDRGIIDPPPVTADLGLYILSGGKLTQSPTGVLRPKLTTLKDLFDGYRGRVANDPCQRQERPHVGEAASVDAGVPGVWCEGGLTGEHRITTNPAPRGATKEA